MLQGLGFYYCGLPLLTVVRPISPAAVALKPTMSASCLSKPMLSIDPNWTKKITFNVLAGLYNMLMLHVVEKGRVLGSA